MQNPYEAGEVTFVKTENFDPKHPEWEVLVDGVRVATARRAKANHGGYWGTWQCGKDYGATRKEAVEMMLWRRSNRNA